MMRKINILCGLMLWTIWAFGQSSSTINHVSHIRDGLNTVHTEQLWIGEHADITVHGIWEIYSSQVYIHPLANIKGNGVIRLMNPNSAVFPLGNSPTIIDGGSVDIDCRIEFNNSNNLMLSSLMTHQTDLNWQGDEGTKQDIVVSKDFEFMVDDGHLILGDDDFVLGRDADLLGYSENRYVVTNGDGGIKKRELDGDFVFPVGYEEGTYDGHDYTPAKINNSGLTDAFTVKVDPIVTDYPNSTEGVSREWTIEEENEGGSFVEVTLQHNEYTNGSKYDSNESKFVTQYVGESPNSFSGYVSSSTWDYAPADCSEESGEGTLTTLGNVTDATELSRSGFFDLYNYTKFTKAVCEKSVLANIWKHVTAEVLDCESVVSWVIHPDMARVEYYIIMRSYDGVNFFPIGNTEHYPGEAFYSFKDHTPPNGDVFYKVVVVDPEGEEEDSETISVNSNCGFQVASIFPNPFYDEVTIALNTTEPIEALILYDEIGRKLEIPVTYNGNLVKLDATRLAAANYYALIIFEDKFYTIELTKILDR